MWFVKTKSILIDTIKKLLKEVKGKHIPEIISKKLHEDINLRNVYIALIKTTPALVSEITKATTLSKQTCYNQLHKLLYFAFMP